jgi:dipeptidase E
MRSEIELLLLSSSLTPGSGFLEHAHDHIRELLGSRVKRVLFIPYAGVNRGYAEMTERAAAVFTTLGYGLESLHASADPVRAVEKAEAVAVSGGNTFRLLALIQEQGLLAPLRARAQAGMPYIGWSAGSNLACPTIRTTNDMPIVWPRDCDALRLIPFQINPHYTELLPPEHQGETRDDRLREFMRVNPGMPVLGLREGSALRVSGSRMRLLGGQNARLFRDGTSRDVCPEEPLELLLARA